MSCFLQHWELKMSYEENKLVLMAHASRLYRMVATMKFTLVCFYQGVVGFFLKGSGISVSAKGLRWQRMTRSNHLASMIQVLLEQEIRISNSLCSLLLSAFLGISSSVIQWTVRGNLRWKKPIFLTRRN